MTDKESWIDCPECSYRLNRRKGYIFVSAPEGGGYFEVCAHCMGKGVVLEKAPPLPPPPPKRSLTIVIEAGETTCAREPGKWCRFVGSKAFGTRPLCMLFPPEDGLGAASPLEDKDGWLQRLPQCIEAEKAGKSL